jgi:hypothetical protein
MLLLGGAVVDGFATVRTTTTIRSNNNNYKPMSWQSSSSSNRLASSRTTAENDTTMIVNGATGTFYNTTTSSPSLPDVVVVANPLTAVNKEPEKEGQQVTISPRMVQARKYASYLCNLFPLWTVLTATTALLKPSIFLSVPKSTFPTQIGLLMLCMGISLKPIDFQRVVQRPMAVLLAFAGCYGLVRKWMVFVVCCCRRMYLALFLAYTYRSASHIKHSIRIRTNRCRRWRTGLANCCVWRKP